jgi:uncharacterized membrane protein YdjX (TVP38/TMEM64 family)
MVHLPPWLRATLAGIVLVGIAAAVIWREVSHPASVADVVDDWNGAAPLAFVAAHVVASLVFIPRTPFSLAAGALFGGVWGTVWAMVGAMAGAMSGFWLARFVNDGAIDVEHLPRIGRLIERAETGGWRFVLVVRIVPIIPHALTYYAFGLTQVPARTFAFGSLLGLAPQTIAFVKLGEAGATAVNGASSWIEPLVWGLLLLAVSFAAPSLLQRRWR